MTTELLKVIKKNEEKLAETKALEEERKTTAITEDKLNV